MSHETFNTQEEWFHYLAVNYGIEPEDVEAEHSHQGENQ